MPEQQTPLQDITLKPLSGQALVFYNVENLYDTIDHQGTNDEDFTPDSPKRWDKSKYHFKIKNISKVIGQIHDQLPIFIGLAEVENAKVVQDLLDSEILSSKKYELVHFESKDERGMDVAFAFDAQFFHKEGAHPLEVDLSTVTDEDYTRDILHVYGQISTGQKLHFFVNHWPSRREGNAESEPKRVFAAQILRKEIDRIMKDNPEALIIIMGDFNDTPANKSIVDILQANTSLTDATDKTLFNLHHRYFLERKGTLVHKGIWNLFDQIIVSQSFFDQDVLDEQSGKIFHKKWLLFRTRKRDYSPNKTYSGDRYHQGYSDHLPVYMIFN
jgi:predicted extracellular nuclease